MAIETMKMTLTIGTATINWSIKIEDKYEHNDGDKEVTHTYVATLSEETIHGSLMTTVTERFEPDDAYERCCMTAYNITKNRGVWAVENKK